MQEEGDGPDESHCDRENSNGDGKVAICDVAITNDYGEVVKVGEDAMEINDCDGEVTEAGEDAVEVDGDGDMEVSKVGEGVEQDSYEDGEVS